MSQQSFKLYCGSIFNAHSSLLYIILTMRPKFWDYQTWIYMPLVVNFKIGKVNFKLSYFEYRFHYYKYMLTNKIVCKYFSVPCSYIWNLSPSANFPSSSYYSNYSSYPWSSLCISPISFICKRKKKGEKNIKIIFQSFVLSEKFKQNQEKARCFSSTFMRLI